jgi:hypothetical protein
MLGMGWTPFGARLRIVIPKKSFEMGVDGFGGTSVFTSGLPGNEPGLVAKALKASELPQKSVKKMAITQWLSWQVCHRL